MIPSVIIESTDPQGFGRKTSVRWLPGRFSIAGDNAVQHGGGGTGPDGFDLLGAALGQCLLNTLIAAAQRDAVRLTGAQAHVSTKARLGRADEAPFLSDFHVDLYVEGDLDDDQRRRLESVAARLCGVRETLMRTPMITEHVHLGLPSGPPA
jgi:uncharacterized OsmC-like protein